MLNYWYFIADEFFNEVGEKWCLANRPSDAENYFRTIDGLYCYYDEKIGDNLWFIRSDLAQNVRQIITNRRSDKANILSEANNRYTTPVRSNAPTQGPNAEYADQRGRTCFFKNNTRKSS